MAWPKGTLTLVAVTVSATGVAISVKLAVPVASLVLAATVRLPAATAVAVTDASPFEPVVAELAENFRPAPENVTTTPETGLLLLSLINTTSGAAKAEPYATLWPEPDTTPSVGAGM